MLIQIVLLLGEHLHLHIVTLQAELEPDSIILMLVEMHNLLLVTTLLQLDQRVVLEREVAQADLLGAAARQVGYAHVIAVGVHAIIVVAIRERHVKGGAGI